MSPEHFWARVYPSWGVGAASPVGGVIVGLTLGVGVGVGGIRAVGREVERRVGPFVGLGVDCGIRLGVGRIPVTTPVDPVLNNWNPSTSTASEVKTGSAIRNIEFRSVTSTDLTSAIR